jgi:NADH:ubiquinone oxidoreductase subunit F (NADH-binding)
MEFFSGESCGKCTPCRLGIRRMLDILTKITHGEGIMEDLAKLEKLANYITKNSLCGLGQMAPTPVLSTLKNFRDEYEAHIKEKRCPLGLPKNCSSGALEKK